MGFKQTIFLSAVLFFQALAQPALATNHRQQISNVVSQWHQRTLKNISHQYGTRITRPLIANISKNKAFETTKNYVAHQGQALLLIMILTGVDLVKQHYQKANILGKPIDTRQLLRHSMEAAEHILNSGEIWSSLTGASVTTAVMHKPVEILNHIVANNVSRDIFKNLLQSGISTFILFIGWEMGGELYREASEMIEDPEDYKLSKNLMNLLVNSLRYGLDHDNPDYEKKWSVLKKVFGNMLTILVYDHDLRNMWLYNTWRNRIATGEFVTLVTSMVAAGVIGTAIFPGAGTLAGMMFGVIGGILTIFIPQSYKDSITSAIQNMRFQFWKMGDDQGPLFNVRRDIIEIMHRVITHKEAWPPLLKYQPVAHSLEHMMNVLIEKIYRLESRLQITIASKESAIQANNHAMRSQFAGQQMQIIGEYQATLDQVSGLYQNSLNNLKAALTEFPILQNTTAETFEQYPELKSIKMDLERLYQISSFLKFFVNSIRIGMIEQNQMYLGALNRFFIFGFSEDKILEQMK